MWSFIPMTELTEKHFGIRIIFISASLLTFLFHEFLKIYFNFFRLSRWSIRFSVIKIKRLRAWTALWTHKITPESQKPEVSFLKEIYYYGSVMLFRNAFLIKLQHIIFHVLLFFMFCLVYFFSPNSLDNIEIMQLDKLIFLIIIILL